MRQDCGFMSVWCNLKTASGYSLVTVCMFLCLRWGVRLQYGWIVSGPVSQRGIWGEHGHPDSHTAPNHWRPLRCHSQVPWCESFFWTACHPSSTPTSSLLTHFSSQYIIYSSEPVYFFSSTSVIVFSLFASFSSFLSLLESNSLSQPPINHKCYHP